MSTKMPNTGDPSTPHGAPTHNTTPGQAPEEGGTADTAPPHGAPTHNPPPGRPPEEGATADPAPPDSGIRESASARETGTPGPGRPQQESGRSDSTHSPADASPVPGTGAGRPVRALFGI